MTFMDCHVAALIAMTWLFLCLNALVAVGVNVIYYRHAYDDYVAGKTHPVRELAKEDESEKGRKENLRIIVN